MKILVTGATGFIGSWTAEHFAAAGHDVVAVSYSGTYGRLKPAENITLAACDLEDKRGIHKLFADHRPEAVVHCAWRGVLSTERNDEALQRKNYHMTLHALEAAIENRAGAFVGLGSQAEYGVHNTRVDESFPTEPKNMYGHYKLRSGLEGREMAEKHRIHFAWLRLFSTFGPKDSDGYLIPYVIQSFLKGEAPQLTDCRQNWDYLYVADIPKLIGKVLSYPGRYKDIYNLCSGQTVVLRDLVLIIRDALQAAVQPDFNARQHRPEGLMHLEGDNRRFHDKFGWTTLTDIEQGLHDTIEWYKAKYKRS